MVVLEVAPGYHKQGLLGGEWEPIEGLDLPYKNVPCAAGDAIVFDGYVPRWSAPNNSSKAHRAIFLTYGKEKAGGRTGGVFADKRASFPPISRGRRTRCTSIGCKWC